MIIMILYDNYDFKHTTTAPLRISRVARFVNIVPYVLYVYTYLAEQQLQLLQSGKKNAIFRIACKCRRYGRLSRGGSYLLASDGKAPLKERPLPLKGGGGGGPCDRLEDRARALSFMYDTIWELCKCDRITTLLEMCRTYSAPRTNGNECDRARALPSIMSSFQDFQPSPDSKKLQYIIVHRFFAQPPPLRIAVLPLRTGVLPLRIRVLPLRIAVLRGRIPVLPYKDSSFTL